MEIQRVIYDFAGRSIDRSVYDFGFDGGDLKLVIEDTTERDAFFEIKFSWVVSFIFECKASIAAVPNYQSESLVELDASDFMESRRHRVGEYFRDDLRRFALYLLDVGDLHVFSRGVTVARKKLFE